MDWKSIHFDWNRARAFYVAAQTGSYSAAARALGTTQPTIGRQVAALEDELQVVLFSRSGHRLSLTPTGQALMARIRPMTEAAAQVSLAASGESEAVVGSVSITASEITAAHLLPPVLRRLRLEHPGIEIELVVSNQAQDLRARDADIAVRNFRTTEPELIGKKMRDAQGFLYASPDYLSRVGGVRTVDDLRRVELFAFDRSNVMIDGLAAMGIPVTREQFPIATSSHLVQWELCKRGLGVCMMMAEVGDREPTVQRVLPDASPMVVPIWLVTHEALHTSRRIRIVFDALAEGLATP